MTTQANQTQQAQPTASEQRRAERASRHTIGSTFSQLLGATSSVISAVDNTAKIAEHVTGTLADKAYNWRESSKVIDAIEHNELMAEYQEQMKELGLTSI